MKGCKRDIVGLNHHQGEIATLTMTLHDAQELDDDLRGRTDEDLALAAALSVDNVVLVMLKSPHTSKRTHQANSPGSRSKGPSASTQPQ